ncbi:MAG: hypothetical protein WEB62_01690, partial [Bacteroidota bacterium]
KTPAAGVLLYVYQTDATGAYNNDDGSWQRPRINGWFRTDKNGRYEIRTIKPGSYPYPSFLRLHLRRAKFHLLRV